MGFHAYNREEEQVRRPARPAVQSQYTCLGPQLPRGSVNRADGKVNQVPLLLP